MNNNEIRIFIRVIKRKMKNEGLSANDILESYPKLSIEDKNKILAGLL